MCIFGTPLTFNEFQISFKRRTNLDTIMRGNAKGVIQNNYCRFYDLS